jgi:hypothetical protein
VKGIYEGKRNFRVRIYVYTQTMSTRTRIVLVLIALLVLAAAGLALVYALPPAQMQHLQATLAPTLLTAPLP